MRGLEQISTDESGVSPVIGVILMVAVTVIIAAVIGSSALGLSDQVSDSPPQASLSFEQENMTYVDNDGTNPEWVVARTVTITHDGGENIDADNVEVTVDNEPAADISVETLERDQLNSDGSWGSDTKYGGEHSGDHPGNEITGTVERVFSGTVTAGTTGHVLVGVASDDPKQFGDSIGQINPYNGFPNSGAMPRMSGGETIRVIWTNGDQSTTLGEYEVKQ